MTRAKIKLQRKNIYIDTKAAQENIHYLSLLLSSHNRCAISKSSCRRTLRRRARCLTIHRNFCRRAWALEKWVVYQGLFILIGYTHSPQQHAFMTFKLISNNTKLFRQRFVRCSTNDVRVRGRRLASTRAISSSPLSLTPTKRPLSAEQLSAAYQSPTVRAPPSISVSITRKSLYHLCRID